MNNIPKANELVIIRTYNAPVAKVWDAWVDDKQTAKWWGPRGFTLTTQKKDVRTGGSWEFVMHGPDRTDYINDVRYLEVKPRELLAYDHGAGDGRPPHFRMSVRFSEQGGMTTMHVIMSCPSAEAAAETKKHVKAAQGETTWDRLGEYLDETLYGKTSFYTNRTFDAPIKRLFQMWSNPQLLAAWLPPTGATMKFLRANIATGGDTHYRMDAPFGAMYGRAQYLTVDAPHLIVYTQEFCDEEERPARHPMAPTWPMTMLTTLRLTEDYPGTTRVTIMWEPHGKVSPEELATFVDGRAGMTAGWGGSFDKLEAFLASQSG